MFHEPHIQTEKPRGWIEIICGPMFSGKTEELLRRLRRAKIANQKMVIFKPSIDIRYGQNKIVSHDANYFPSLPVKHSSEILKNAGSAQLVAIDEVQFFDEDVVKVAEELAVNGKRVICAGLDMDYLGVPFGPMPQLLAVANYITKIQAICLVCGSPATHSFRIAASKDQVALGEKESYEARCRQCFNAGMKAKSA
ncbi:MAG: thymidine kinase [Bacteroidetes bacterium]|nr:thymidine kinase [Bacteroidota bacterium]